MKSDWMVALVIVLVASLLSCRTGDAMQYRTQDAQGLFVANGKRYVLDPARPGVIHDADVISSADAGARSFDFSTRRVWRHLYVGRFENFGAIADSEKEEINGIVRGALHYLNNLKEREGGISDVDERHRVVLETYLREQRNRPSSSTCPCATPPRRSASETASRISKMSWPGPPPGARIQGTVVFEITVSAEGSIHCVNVIAGHPLLLAGLAPAILKWTFRAGSAFCGTIAVEYSSTGYRLRRDG